MPNVRKESIHQTFPVYGITHRLVLIHMLIAYTHTHISTQIHTFTHIQTQTSAHIQVYTYICTYTHTYTYTYTHIRTYVHALIHTYTYMYIQTKAVYSIYFIQISTRVTYISVAPYNVTIMGDNTYSQGEQLQLSCMLIRGWARIRIHLDIFRWHG